MLALASKVAPAAAPTPRIPHLITIAVLALVACACGSGPAVLLTASTPVASRSQTSANGTAAARIRPLADLSIQLEQIPDQAGAGWLWVRANYSVHKPGCLPPEFSVSPATADIYTWTDPYVAYMGGVPGTYVITAKGCGATGQLTVAYEGGHQ